MRALRAARLWPAGVSLAGMAATRPSPTDTRVGGARTPGAAGWSVSGPVRPGRKTKLLVGHMVAGDIALVDHLDIDRVSAEELIAAGTRAVLNCSE